MAQTAVKKPMIDGHGLERQRHWRLRQQRWIHVGSLSGASIQPEYTHRLLQPLGLILQ